MANIPTEDQSAEPEVRKKPKLGVDEIDGRPLYRYQIDLHSADLTRLNSIETWEMVLSNPNSRDDQIIKFIAPVAAARFASNYEEGNPSWRHCGEVVSGLRDRNGKRFSYFIHRSLELYGVKILQTPGADELLETIVGQAGIPSGILRPGKPLRPILNELMKRLASGDSNLLDLAKKLIDEVVKEKKLRQAYRDAGHLPRLCIDLVESIIVLIEMANWSGGSLDPIWSTPDWEHLLPFRVDEAAAKEIVSQLLNVVVVAQGGSNTRIERILHLTGGEWRLKTRASVPSEGIDLSILGLEASPSIAAVFYTANGQPIDEAYRIRQKPDGTYRLASSPGELTGNQGAWDSPIALALRHGVSFLPMQSAGGDALDSVSTWVFEPRNGEYVFKAPAPVRLRSRELLIAVGAGSRVSGDAVRIAGASLKVGNDVSAVRDLWKVTGQATIEREGDDPARIVAGYDGPQSYLDFHGRSPSNYQVQGYTSVFVGNPEPRRIGGIGGRIQWRKHGETEWKSVWSSSATGLLAFRLTDENGTTLAERRRVLVLPEGFRPEVTMRSVTLRLPTEFSLSGQDRSPEGRYTVEFGTAAKLSIDLVVPGAGITVLFTRPVPGAFVNLLSREQFSTGLTIINARVMDRMSAQSTQSGRYIEISRTQDKRNAYPIALHGDRRLNLLDIKPFLQALAFHPRARNHNLRIEFQNAAAIEVDFLLSRIQREGWELKVQGAPADAEIELKPLTASHAEEHETLVPERVSIDTWTIPDLNGKAPLYLAVDRTRQAYPSLVVGVTPQDASPETFTGVVCMKIEADREQALVKLYREIVDTPHSAKSEIELDICLNWISDFQLYLEWLDPFLVLASTPELAVKVLVLAELRGYSEGASSMLEALDKVPFFGHSITNSVLANVSSWAISQFGMDAFATVRGIFNQIPIPRTLMEPAGDNPFQPIEKWQTAVNEHQWLTAREKEQRSPALADFANRLWGRPDVPDNVRSKLRTRPRTISTDVDLARTYFLAPQEFALAVVLGVEMDDAQRADFIYSRYVIGLEQFDAAYCASLRLIEGN